MARQKGIIKLKGTVGGITFYKTQDGHLAREKGGVDASRIKNDPAFQRTRENGSELGRAGTAGRVLRTSIRGLLLNSADNRMVSRLTQKFTQVIQADATSIRGERNVIDGEAELLDGFEFNIRGKLGTSLYAPFVPTIDRVTGQIKVVIPSFIPANMIAAPSGTTHYKIISAGVEIDFATEIYVAPTSASAVLPWGVAPSTALTQTNTVTPASTKPLFLMLGIEFFQLVNGTMYPLKNGAFNPLAIAKVSGL